MVNLAILGTGGIARGGHGSAFADAKLAQLWSVCSRDLDKAKILAKDLQARSPIPAFDSLEKLLSDPALDGVIITTPDKLHAEHAMLCAEAGKHILLEKPMVTNLEQADELIKICNLNKTKIAVAYHLRWHQGHRTLVSAIHNGLLGDIRHVRAQWTWKAPDGSNWRASPDVGRWWSLGGVGTHCLDLIRWILLPTAGEVVMLNSVISNQVWNSPHDESALVSMKFENRATAEILSSVLFDSLPRLEIYGTNGYAICEGTFGRHGKGSIWTNLGEFKFEPMNPFALQIDKFARMIESDESPEVSIAEGRRNIELLLSAA
jgi:predicted dehydrogenase